MSGRATVFSSSSFPPSHSGVNSPTWGSKCALGKELGEKNWPQLLVY